MIDRGNSNLARYDGVSYGMRVADNLVEMSTKETRTEGFDPEVQRPYLVRYLMY